MGFEVIGEVPEESVKLPEGATVLGEAPSANWTDVLSGVPARTGLSFIQAVGGGVQALGDLLRMDSLSDWGNEVARTAKGAAAESLPPGMTTSQQVVSSGLESAGQMLPAIALAPESLAAAGIGLAAGQQAGSRYPELRDAGFSGGAAALHAGIDGIAEALGEKISLPVLAQASRPFLNKLYTFMARDMAGEQLTTAIESLNAALSDNPDMTLGDYLQAAKMTALVTPIAAGAQVAIAHTVQGARGTLASRAGDGTAIPPASLPSAQPEQIPATAVTPPEAPAPTPESAPKPKGEKPQTPEEVVTPPEVPAPTPESAPQAPQPPATVAIEPNEPDPVPPPEPPAPTTPTEVAGEEVAPNALALTPQESAQSGLYDPRVYNGLNIRETNPAYFSIEESPNEPNTFTLEAKGLFNTVRGNADTIINSLLEILPTLPDIRLDPAAHEQLYDSYVLNKIMSQPDSWLDITPSVNARFGGILQELAKSAETRNTGLLPEAGGNAPAAMYKTYESNVNLRGGPAYTGDLIALGGKKSITISGVNAGESLSAGTYSDPLSMAEKELAPVLRYVEVLRKRFLKNSKIVVSIDSKIPGDGQLSALKNGIYHIKIKQLDKAAALVHVVHEFGHAVWSEHFQQAEPGVKASLMLSYLNYTQSVKRDTPLLDYLLEHTGDNRGVSDKRSVGALGASQMNYFLGPSEYFADQAAQILLGRTSFQGALKYWYAAGIAKIKAVYDFWKVVELPGAVKGFQKNETFAEWLSKLGGADKISDGAPRTKDKPAPSLTEIQNAPTPEAPLEADRGAMLRQKQRLLRALEKAGASEEQLDAITGPNGLLHEFKWEQALELADTLGVPPKDYMERRRLGSVDDTTSLREGVHQLNLSLSDPSMREDLGEANAAVKSFNWALQKTITAVQLRKRFGAQVPGVKSFVDSLERMFAYRSRWKEIADDRLKQMKLIPQKERDRVFSILLEEDKSGKFAGMVGIDPTTKLRTFTLSPEVAKQNNLTDKGVQLYSSIREDFDRALDEIENNAVRELERLYGDSPSGAKRILELKSDFADMRAKPYVPHSRFGTHTVTVRGPTGKVMEFHQFETSIEAVRQERTIRAEVAAAHPDWTVSRGRLSEEVRAFMGLPPTLISAMKANLNLDEKQIDSFEEMIKDMSSGASFVRRFKKRKNIAGWEDEAKLLPRAYADYYSRFANHASRIRFNPDLNAATQQVRQQARDTALQGSNTVELDNLSSWLRRLQDYVNNPGSEFANARAAATIWYLGLMPKSALVNGLGVPMVTTPYLAKRFGWVRSFAATTQAYKDVARMYSRAGALTDEERTLLEHLRERGLIDASFASELAGIREGGRLSDMTMLSKPAAAFFGVKQYAMWMFHKMEVLNRTVTALAAYRLNRNPGNVGVEGFDPQSAAFASTTIQDTQNENGVWNRAEYTRNRKGVLTMFMSYQQNMIYQMFGGDESWMRLLAVQMAVAGLMGIPFAKDADDLIRWFTRRVFGSDMSLEKAIRAYLKDTVVDADWVLRGGSHNVFGLDLQGSTSMGRVIPGIQALASEGDFNARIANAAGDVGGAGFSVIMDAMKAAASNDPRYLTRFQQLMPQAAKAWTEGAKALTNGRIDDLSGAKVADVTPAEAVARMAGFQITDATMTKQKRFAEKDTAQYWINRRNEVLAIYGLAASTRDPGWREKGNSALREFNAQAPDGALRITAAQIQAAMKRRLVGNERRERDIGPSNTQTGVYRAVGSTYQ